MFQADVALCCMAKGPWSLGVALFALLRAPTCERRGDPAPIQVLGPRLEVEHEALGRLQPGDRVGAGELVQLRYRAAGYRYGVIVSLDGAGVVTLHHPARPDAPPRIRPHMPTLLGHAFELDHAPDFERFFFVTAAARPPSTASILEAARRLGAIGFVAGRAMPLPLPEDLAQTSFLLRKSP